MCRLLGFALATAAAMALVALTAGQAFANHVQCGDVITQDTTLDADLVCPAGPPGELGLPSAALVIGASNVTLDLGGHTIRAESGLAIGTGSIDDPPARSDITIQNGVLAFGGIGLNNVTRPVIRSLTLTETASLELPYYTHFGNTDALIEDNTILGAPDLFARLNVSRDGGSAVVRDNVIRYGGIYLGRTSATVIDNSITHGEIGIFASNFDIARNRIFGSISVGRGRGSIRQNVISGGSYAGIDGGFSNVTVERNVITRNGGNGVRVGAGTGSGWTIRDNTITRNGGNGVLVEGGPEQPLASAQVIGNRITDNALDGVHMGHCLNGPLVEDNTTGRNGDDGVEVVQDLTECPYEPGPRPTTPTTVSGNHAWRNGDLGVEGALGTLGGGNWAKHNGNPLQCLPGALCSTTGKPKSR